MIELKKYEGGSSFEAETYRNGKLTNSLQAIRERKTETEKKIDLIIYFARISKVRDPDILRNYVSDNGIDRIAKIYNEEILNQMLEYFRRDSWEALKENSINKLQKVAPFSKKDANID